MRLHPIIIAAMLASVGGGALAAETPPICADRPGKATPTCTVPRGMVQIETGLADWTRDSSGGVRTDSLALGAFAFKVGLSDRWHVELDAAPYNEVRVHGGGLAQRDSGFGDIFLRSKTRLTAGDGVQVALLPFIKLPTASHAIGNGKVEGGLAVPIDYAVPHSAVQLTLGPELDWQSDDDGGGHHPAMIQVVGLSLAATKQLSLSAELWGRWNWDHAGTTRQASADGAVAYQVNDNLQLDAGANIGLNRQTPDVELYSGISALF